MANRRASFTWTAFYYLELLAELKRLKAERIPEHTETGDADPIAAILELVALMGHRGAVLIDHVAQENLYSSARLRASFFPWARLLRYPLAGPAAATVEVLADLAGSVSGTVAVWREGSKVATRSTTGSAPVMFEIVDGPIEVTNTGAWTFREDDGGTLSAPAWPWSPFAGSPVVAVGDAFYIGHPSAMFSAFRQNVTTIGLFERPTIVWEYPDDRRELPPGSVTDLGASIRFDVHELLTGGQFHAIGQPLNAGGALVRVRCLTTGEEETIAAVYASGTHTITSSALGQGVISSNLGDYRVSADWIPLPGQVDGTVNVPGALWASWQLSGVVRWTHPDGPDRRWARATVDGVEAFWIRGRVVGVGGTRGVAAVLDAPIEDAATVWTVRAQARQGEAVEDVLGSWPFGPDQRPVLSRGPVMAIDAVTVAGEAWDLVDSFLRAGPSDRVVRVREEPDGSWMLSFGDGERGALPVGGGAVVVRYRVGGDISGNVGAGELRVDRSGNGKIRNLRNPIAADGWAAAEGSTAEDLELLRDRLSAHLATLGGAIGPEDYGTLAEGFRDTLGSQVVARAIPIEEGHGLKTVEVVCVGVGGAVPTADELAQVEAYLNGEVVGVERVGGLVAANTRAVATAYAPQIVNVTAVLRVLRGFGATAQDAGELAIRAALSPLARRLSRSADGRIEESAAYLWRLAGDVELAAVTTRVALAVPGFVDLAISIPAANPTLGARELPTPGTISLSVVEVAG